MCIKEVTVPAEAIHQNFEYDNTGTSRYWHKCKNEISDCLCLTKRKENVDALPTKIIQLSRRKESALTSDIALDLYEKPKIEVQENTKKHRVS